MHDAIGALFFLGLSTFVVYLLWKGLTEEDDVP